MPRLPLLPLCAAAAAACGSVTGGDADDRLVVAAYTAPREALERAVIPAFRRHFKEKTGRDVAVRASYLGSGAQSRAVVDGFPADVVLLALEPDVDRIAAAGLVAPDWRERTGRGGFVARTLVVIAVRPGNPRGVRDFADLARPGLDVLTPNPLTSGGALWNVLAVWGSAQPPERADALLRAVFANVVVMDKGARESIVNFEKGIGDAAITYEQEVHVARLAGRRYDYVIPPATMRVEIPAAVVDRNVDRRGTRALAEEFLAFLQSPRGQRLLSDYGFRPLDAPLPPGVFGVERFGGWGAATARLLGDDGVLTRLLGESER